MKPRELLPGRREARALGQKHEPQVCAGCACVFGCLPPEDPCVTGSLTLASVVVVVTGTGRTRVRLVMKESIQFSCSGENGGGSADEEVPGPDPEKPAIAVTGGVDVAGRLEAVVISSRAST